jgi:hypothetical protein
LLGEEKEKCVKEHLLRETDNGKPLLLTAPLKMNSQYECPSEISSSGGQEERVWRRQRPQLEKALKIPQRLLPKKNGAMEDSRPEKSLVSLTPRGQPAMPLTHHTAPWTHP